VTAAVLVKISLTRIL